MINIPSISERQYRPCDTCVWTDELLCSCKMCMLDYEVVEERTACDVDKYPLLHPIVQSRSCRFHMTSDELKMILDPYFME